MVEAGVDELLISVITEGILAEVVISLFDADGDDEDDVEKNVGVAVTTDEELLPPPLRLRAMEALTEATEVLTEAATEALMEALTESRFWHAKAEKAALIGLGEALLLVIDGLIL